jgi:hypothetical protein
MCVLLSCRQQAADEAFRRLDGDLAGMRSRLLTLEGAVKAKVCVEYHKRCSRLVSHTTKETVM